MEFADNLMALRKRRGLTQEELGNLVGASRQAVSKWETGQTTPELSKMIELARIFEVSTDELLGLTPERPVEAQMESAPAEGRGEAHVRAGLPLRACGCEYKSEREFCGLPLVHINLGRGGHRRARGVIAIGNAAVGIVAIGYAACGLFSIGCVSCGLIALGCLAAGFAAFGSVAAGVIAVGAVAVGAYAVGGLAVGQCAVGGAAIAGDFAYGGYASGWIAVGDSVSGANRFPLESLGTSWQIDGVMRCLDEVQSAMPRGIVRFLLSSLQ